MRKAREGYEEGGEVKKTGYDGVGMDIKRRGRIGRAELSEGIAVQKPYHFHTCCSCRRCRRPCFVV